MYVVAGIIFVILILIVFFFGCYLGMKLEKFFNETEIKELKNTIKRLEKKQRNSRLIEYCYC